MGIKQDAEESLKDYFITKIDGQPSEEAISKLKLELSEGLASIPTLNGGGRHGHIGLIIPNAEYTIFSHNNAPYDILANPGPYPTTVDPDAVARERQIAEHKAEIREYEMQLGVTSWARKAIVGAVDEEWISEIRNPHVGFNHLMPSDLLTHLEAVGGELDFMDVTELQAELLKPWDQVEAPTTLFERQDKIEKHKAGIPAQHELRLATALCWFQQSGEFDSALELWEAKPTANKTLSAFRIHSKGICQAHKTAWNRKRCERGRAQRTSHGRNRQCSTGAKQRANGKDDGNVQGIYGSHDKTTRHEHTCRGQHEHDIKCPHCNLRHPKPDNCWELEKNASKRPQNWKPAAERKKARVNLRRTNDGLGRRSRQSSGGRVRFPLPRHHWTFPPPPNIDTQGQDGVHNTIDCCVAALLPSKTTLKWARRLARWRTRRKLRTAEEALLDSGATSSLVQSEHDVQLTGKSDKMVRAADGGLMPASSTGLLALTTLRQGAREALVVPGLKPKALMSVSPLANNGYTTIFHPHDEGVTCSKVYMTYHRQKKSWRFLHAALGFPTKATLLAAARNGNLVTFPGLTPDNVNRHFPESDETQKGHMRQTRQVPDEDAMLEHKPTPGVKHKDVYLRVFDATKKPMYTDQSGPLPRKSRRNNQYVMIAVELDGNYIDAEPLKTRKAKDLTGLPTDLQTVEGNRSHLPQLAHTDNERLKNSSKQFVRTVAELN
eukprot:CCRYP_008424-RA/>CCRYP_008424-RA protein AED:0.29 eAED:0.29 QI:0/0/0/1/0.16/0.14/7/0/719